MLLDKPLPLQPLASTALHFVRAMSKFTMGFEQTRDVIYCTPSCADASGQNQIPVQVGPF